MISDLYKCQELTGYLEEITAPAMEPPLFVLNAGEGLHKFEERCPQLGWLQNLPWNLRGGWQWLKLKTVRIRVTRIYFKYKLSKFAFIAEWSGNELRPFLWQAASTSNLFLILWISQSYRCCTVNSRAACPGTKHFFKKPSMTTSALSWFFSRGQGWKTNI